jgi:hypothetical protein
MMFGAKKHANRDLCWELLENPLRRKLSNPARRPEIANLPVKIPEPRKLFFPTLKIAGKCGRIE